MCDSLPAVISKVLVTGGAGFIGAHVSKHCIANGMDVVVLDDLSGGFEENVPPGAEFVRGSTNDTGLLRELFDRHQFRYVYHLAAYAAEGLSHFIRHFNYETNLIGSVNLINESVRHDVQCFLFASSIAVYGAGQTPMVEELVPQPEDPYGISKYAVELDLKAAHHMFGLPYIVFRPHNVYGELQNIADRYRNVIGIFMNQVMQRQPMTIFGDGMQTRAFSYIDDVAPIIARAPAIPEAYNQVFNVGADQAFSVVQLANEIGRVFEVEPSVVHLTPRNEVVHAFANHDKVEKCFGHSGKTSLREGISRMALWVKQHGPRVPIVFNNIEIEKNLPNSWVTQKSK
jgi:UDP-glucose 4-epimerase